MTDFPSNELTVMVVEDHPDQRELLQIILQKEGYQVIVAQDGLDAWQKLKNKSAHIMLLDILMPKMDNLELLRHIRGEERLKDIYVVFVTAKRQERDVVNGLDSGANDYVIKPYSFSELLARVRAGATYAQRLAS